MADGLQGRVDELTRTGRRRGMARTGFEASGVLTSPARSRGIGTQTGSAPAAGRARPSTPSTPRRERGMKSTKSRAPRETMLGRVVSRNSPAMLTKQFAQHRKELDEMTAEAGRPQQQAQASFIEAARDPGRRAPFPIDRRSPPIAAPKVAEQPFLEQVEPAARTRPVRLSSSRRGK